MSTNNTTATSIEPKVTPTLAELFVAFATIGLTGFGGVLPWTRRMIVERKRWIDAMEFAELLPLAQLLPGPNVANIATILGRRYQGALGSAVAVLGLYLFPAIVTIGLGFAYARWSTSPVAARLLSGLMPAATGLVVATSAKLIGSLPRTWTTCLFVVLPAVTVGLLHWPLLLVVLILGPVTVWLAHRSASRSRA
jgi:chromate transporter